jgi:hypothetical protein
VIFFPRLRGSGRLALDAPLALLGLYCWYVYLSSLPAAGRNSVISTYWNPLGVTGILCILVHQTGISYLRDQLPREKSFFSRLALCVPGRVLALYKKLHGTDRAVKVVRAFGLAAVILFLIVIFVLNGVRPHLQ